MYYTQAVYIKEYLQIIISFQSEVSYAEQKRDVISFCSDILNDLGISFSKQVFYNQPCLFMSAYNTKKPKVLLQAHLDVVPGSLEQFHLVEKDGKYFGRGVFDMKFAAACYLRLAEELKDQLDELDFGIMLTTDEEIGGENGVGKLLAEGYGADVCILPDGGDNWQLESEANGVWLIKLVSKGTAAHGSRPWEGKNAIETLLTAYEEIRAVFAEHHPDNCSCVISQIEGGRAVNQVPNYAELTLDMRFIDDAHYDRKRKHVLAIVKKHDLLIETIADVPPAKTDLEHPLVAEFVKTAETVLGKPIGTTRSHGSSDARYFHAACIPTILIRPPGGGHHGDEEWIDIEGLEKFYEILKAYVLKVAKTP